MKKVFSYGVASVQGAWPVQEDGYFVHPSRSIYSIADGFGGQGAGDMAAKLVLSDLRDISMQAGEDWQQKDFFENSNKKLNKWNEPKNINKKGGCSFVLAQVSSDRVATISQCGSCAAFVIRGGKLSPLLLPQSDPQLFSDLLIPQNALGMGENIFVEQRVISLQPGDFLLMGSSGLHWYNDGFIEEFLQQLAARGSAGGDLGPLVNHLAEHFSGSGEGLNRSLLTLEIC